MCLNLKNLSETYGKLCYNTTAIFPIIKNYARKTMKLSNLIKQLDDISTSWGNICESEENIYRTEILSPKTVPEKGYLYICTEKSLNRDLDVAGYSFLCIVSNLAQKENSSFKNANLIYGGTKLSKDDVSNQIKLVIENNNLLNDHINRLVETFQANRGIQALVGVAYDILKNPILLVDSSYKILAAFENVLPGRPDIEEQSKAGYLAEANIAAIEKAQLYKKAREKNYPHYQKEKDADQGWITALVYIHGIESAHIAVTDNNRPFTHNDFELIHFLTKLISLELQKDDFYSANESLMHSYFLSELLNNLIRDIPTIERRAQTLKWKVTESLHIMTITETSSSLFDKKAQLIAKQMHELVPNSRWVIFNDDIVFLIFKKQSTMDRFDPGKQLLEFFKVNHLTAAVSREFKSLMDTQRFYNEAKAAYQFGQRFNPDETIHYYTDYMVQHIGGILAENHPIENFYHPSIAKIREYDIEHQTNLLETLDAYITNPDNPTLVSELLHIHKNTLFYRMNKIKELFSVNLSDGEERLKIHLTLKFMQLE